jgi:hypothetical protein
MLYRVNNFGLSKACFCGRSLAGIAGSSPAGGKEICLLLVLFFCHVEDCIGQIFIQRSATECGVLNVILKLKKRRPGPTRAVEP